jgi:hypothetical protein
VKFNIKKALIARIAAMNRMITLMIVRNVSMTGLLKPMSDLRWVKKKKSMEKIPTIQSWNRSFTERKTPTKIN